jgi:hypothetical protein
MLLPCQKPVLLTLAWLVIPTIIAAQDLPVEIRDRCESVCQVSDAAWRTIPWQVDLLEAQRMAVEQSKPIFIWAMDGHPLGCT